MRVGAFADLRVDEAFEIVRRLACSLWVSPDRSTRLFGVFWNMSLESVDWDSIPAPVDQGDADHLVGCELPSVALGSTDGAALDLAALSGTTVVYCYPMTGQPGVALPEGWDIIPGARGCTPQSCSFRDHFVELRESGCDQLFGVATQATGYQSEAVERLHLPFPLLSDADHRLLEALQLPTMEVNEVVLLRRLTLIVVDGTITDIHYPVFPPDLDADWVIQQLSSR